MSATNFNNPFVQFHDDDGNPLSLGRVTWLEPGTVSTLKYVFTDPDRTPAHRAQNPMVLGADGYTQEPVFMGIGNYAVRLEKSDGAGGYIPYKFVDPYVTGEIDTTAYQEMFIVNTIAELLGVDHTAHPAVKVLGYYVPGDGGGGDFLWNNAETHAGDNGVYFGSGGSGRWVRTIVNSTITLAHYGAFPGGTDSVSGRISDAITFVNDNPKIKLFCPSGDYVIASSVSFVGDITVEYASDFALKGDGGSAKTVTVSCFASRQGIEPMVKDTTLGAEVSLAWLNGDANLEWYGLHNQDGSNPTVFNLPYQQAMATLQDGATLRVSRKFSMTSAGCTPSKRVVEFVASGEFIINGPTTLGEFKNSSAHACLSGSMLPTSLTLTGNAPVQISAFTAGSVTAEFLASVFYIVGYLSTTDNGRLLWDIPVTVTGALASANYDSYVTSSFAPGVMVTSQVSGTPLGYIDPSQQGQIIATGSSPVVIRNLRIPIRWFSPLASSNIAARVSGLQLAIQCGGDKLVTVFNDSFREYPLSSYVYIPAQGIDLEDFQIRFTGGSSCGFHSATQHAWHGLRRCAFTSDTGASNTPVYNLYAYSGRIVETTFSRLKVIRNNDLTPATYYSAPNYVTVFDTVVFDRTHLYMQNNSFATWRNCRWTAPAGHNDVGTSDHICQLEFAGSFSTQIDMDASNTFEGKYTSSTEYWGSKLIDTGTPPSSPTGGFAYAQRRVEPSVSGRSKYARSNGWLNYPVKSTKVRYSYDMIRGGWCTFSTSVTEGSAPISGGTASWFVRMWDIGVHGLQLFASDSSTPVYIESPTTVNFDGDQSIYANDALSFRFVTTGVNGTNPKYIRMAEIHAMPPASMDTWPPFGTMTPETNRGFYFHVIS